MERKEKLVEMLWQKGIIKFNAEETEKEEGEVVPIKSPMYANFAEIIDDDEICALIVEILSDKIDQKIKEGSLVFDFIVGVSRVGIHIGILIAKKYSIPFTQLQSGGVYTGKKYTLNPVFNSPNKDGGRAIMVEDLTYTHPSMAKEIQLVERSGHHVQIGASILTYKESENQEEILNSNIPVISALSINEVLIICIKKNIIKLNESDILKRFFEDPTSWYRRNFPGTASN
jgi:orotate phosphoribosyltransferase